jgi:hypothetical protein
MDYFLHHTFGEESLRSQSLDTIGVDQATLEKYGHTRATVGTSARASRERIAGIRIERA